MLAISCSVASATTTPPARERVLTSPSVSSRLSASRIGARETPRRRASSSWLSRPPDSNSPEKMASRMAW